MSRLSIVTRQWSELCPQERVHVYLDMMGIAPHPEIVEAFTATCMYAATKEQVDRVGELIRPVIKTTFNKMQEDLYALKELGVKYEPMDRGVPF